MLSQLNEYANQVAGKNQLLVPFESHVLKPTCKIEYDHYKNMKEVHPELATIVPHCCFVIGDGKVTAVLALKCHKCSENVEVAMKYLQGASLTGYYIVLQDLGINMVNPRTLDLKIGTRTWGDDKTEAKKKEMAEKDAKTTTSSLGIRISGCMYLCGEEVVNMTKKDIGLLNKQECLAHLNAFFDIKTAKLVKVIDQVKKIYSIIQRSDNWTFVGSSILFIIDDERCDDSSVAVKLIDLAHTKQSSEIIDGIIGVDSGALFGVGNLLQVLDQIHMGKNN